MVDVIRASPGHNGCYQDVSQSWWMLSGCLLVMVDVIRVSPGHDGRYQSVSRS